MAVMPSTVLLIEDSATFRALLSSMLVTQGYSVINAENGESGIRRAVKERPSVVILDLSLPGISGVDVLSTLKEAPETGQIPVIICTASVDGELRQEVQNRGADEIFTKPVTPKDLFVALRKHLSVSSNTAGSSGSSPT
jgi:CheY-like chemotaxis protein